jgi:hypothetical protein
MNNINNQIGYHLWADLRDKCLSIVVKNNTEMLFKINLPQSTYRNIIMQINNNL